MRHHIPELSYTDFEINTIFKEINTIFKEINDKTENVFKTLESILTMSK